MDTPVQIIDATPPADFPKQVIFMDKEFAKRHPSKAFYLRISNDSCQTTEVVALDNAVTPLQARKMAIALGYAPTHWMLVTDRTPTQFY